EDITQILAGLRKEVEQLPATHRAIRKLVEEAAQATSELNQQAGGTMHAVERMAGTMERTVPELSDKLGTSIAAVGAAATQMKLTAEEAQAALRNARPLVDQGEVAAREAADVFGAAKRVWPLSDSFRETSDGMLPIDSFEAQK